MLIRLLCFFVHDVSENEQLRKFRSIHRHDVKRIVIRAHGTHDDSRCVSFDVDQVPVPVELTNGDHVLLIDKSFRRCTRDATFVEINEVLEDVGSELVEEIFTKTMNERFNSLNLIVIVGIEMIEELNVAMIVLHVVLEIIDVVHFFLFSFILLNF